MRYFVAGWLLLCVLVVSVLGFRGTASRKPPIEIFPDMDRQLKLRPQTPNDFFADDRSSRRAVAGTIARGESFLDAPVNTGFVTGTTNFVENIPMAVSAPLMARGRERFQINCSPCHGPVGDGKGITTKFGMAVIRNLHEARIVQMTDGELFHVITHGRGLMLPYAATVETEDRWAIVAYVRALQLSRLASIEDVPAEVRGTLKK